MFSRISSRIVAAIVAAVIVFGSLGTTAPALAADSTASSASARVSYTGFITELGDAASTSSTKLFRVIGRGYLSIDFSRVELPATRGAVSVDLKIPAGIVIGETEESQFAALSAYNTAKGTLTALAVDETGSGAGTDAMFNRSPIDTRVHKIFAVLVTPSGVAGTKAHTSQKAAKVAAAVDYADDYWGEQSGGKVGFELEGVVPFYKSSYKCSTDAGSTNLWKEAAKKAKSIGYVDAYNNHLVLFFPATVTTQCGGGIGLGTIGSSVNSGGLVWSVGTDSPTSLATLTHELGHNMTFGHANWADCASANPNPGTWSWDFGSGDSLPGCSAEHYGDILDVMGYGLDGKTGGALSSPSAIRGGLWDSAAYIVANAGVVTTAELNAVSSDDGPRAVVVEDTDGVNYFVEFRDFSDEDAQYSPASFPTGRCERGACLPDSPGVRVLRFDDYYADKGSWGDDVFLVGRTVGGVKRVNYVAGESFVLPSGLTVTVNAVGPTTATVQVERPFLPGNAVAQGDVYVAQTLAHSSRAFSTGDTITAFATNEWVSNGYTFQWLRNNAPISGATEQSYVLQAADLGAYIAVQLTGTGPGQKSARDPKLDDATGYGPVVRGPMKPGTTTVLGTTPLTVETADWPSGASFSYQWYRGTKAIVGATSSTYALASADRNAKVKVRVTATAPGYLATTDYSHAKDYTISATGPKPTIVGTARAGAVINATVNAEFWTVDGPVAAPSFAYKWYRDGKAIAGATDEAYTAQAADVGSYLTVTVTTRAVGYAPYAATSSKSGKVKSGIIAGTRDIPIVSKEDGALTLTATIPPGSITETGVSYSYQWYRGTAAIKKATANTYTLASADRAKSVSVRVTVKKSKYTTAVLASEPTSYTVADASGPRPVLMGPGTTESTLEVIEHDFTAGGEPVDVSVSYQWFRNGKAIAGAVESAYIVKTSDKGTALSVRVTAAADGYLPSVLTSVSTQKVAANALNGWADEATIDQVGADLFAVAGVDADSGAKLTYRWYRGTKAITKATKVKYTPVAADSGTSISVRITATRAGYVTVVKKTEGVIIL